MENYHASGDQSESGFGRLQLNSKWSVGGSIIEREQLKTCRCLAKKELEIKYMEFREKCQKEYDTKLEFEIQKLSSKTSSDLERLMRAENENLQREITSLKDSKLFLERGRDEVLAKVRDLNIQNQELLLQMKQLQFMDSARLSGVESELKLKNFELERCSLLLTESETKYKHMETEREKLSEKLDVVKEELSKLQCESEQKICLLKLRVNDKATRLDAYERLENELDNAVIQAAALPDSDSAEAVLSAYGYGANIPCSAKRRLQHSLSLARRVMELEHRSKELKESIFKERDQRHALQQQLDASNAAILVSGYPTTQLLELIAKKDTEIVRCHGNLKTLQSETASLKQVVVQLRKDLEQAQIHQTELESIRHLIAASDSKGRIPSSTRNVKDKLNRVKYNVGDPIANLTRTGLPLPASGAQGVQAARGLHFRKPLIFSKVIRSKDLEHFSSTKFK